MRHAEEFEKSISFALVILVAAGSFASSGFSFKKKKNPPQESVAEAPAAPAAPVVPASELERELEELKASYALLETDRDNVLQQTRILLSQKSQLGDVQEVNNALMRENSRYQKHEKVMRNRVVSQIQRLRIEKEAKDDLQAKYADLSKRYVSMDQENEQLGRALAGKIETDPEFLKLVSETQQVRKESETVRGAFKKSEEERNKANKIIAKLQEEDKKSDAEIAGLKEKIAALEQDRRDLMDHGQKLIKEVERAPQRFGEMAQENKLLIRETSDMHYNLGVFFAESRNYDRAVKEFERALDFNPNNAKVHYNLGYLYSEQFKRHDEAMNHFQRYLDLDPNAKESEDVRKYLLVQKTYGSSPLLEEKGAAPK